MSNTWWPWTPGEGGTPIHYLCGYVPPNGVVSLKLLIQNGVPFERRFLERGIIFRTHESSSFVSSQLKLFKDRLLLKIRFSALTSKLLYSCCTLQRSIKKLAHFQNGVSVLGRILERGIKNWPISRTGYQFQGKFFLERGANLESRGATYPPKKYPSAPRG